MITKDNYLEFFLSYVDKELSAAEEACVKDFIDKNPIYKIELQQLLLTCLKSEPIEAFKNNLYKPNVVAIDGINETNYELYFTAAIDNELSNDELDALNQFIYKNPPLKTAFETLKKCTLVIEPVIFYNKEILLKREEHKKRFFYIKTIAAAALLFISIGSIWLYMQYKNNIVPVYVLNNNNKLPTTLPKNDVKLNDTVNTINNLINNNTLTNNTTNNNLNNIIAKDVAIKNTAKSVVDINYLNLKTINAIVKQHKITNKQTINKDALSINERDRKSVV